MTEIPSPQPESKKKIFSDDEAYEKAKEWLKSQAISSKEIITLWIKRLTFYENLSPERQNMIDRRIILAKKIFPLVQEALFQRLLELDPGKKYNLDQMLRAPQANKEEERIYQIAASFVFFKLYADSYTEAKSIEEKESLKTSLNYFGAMHDFFVGAKTDCYEFTRLMSLTGQLHFDLIEEMGHTKEFSDKVMSMLFPGYSESSNGHPKAI